MSLSSHTTIVPAQPGWGIRHNDSIRRQKPIIAWAIDALTGIALPVTCDGVVERVDQYTIYFNGEEQ
jgi:hypothetical protein